jgi:outer membrane protein assembly factor BamB
MLLSLGFQVLAIDTLGTPGKDGPRVLWRQDLTDVLAGRPGQMGIHGQAVNMPWGQPRFVAADGHNRQVGNTGPLTDEFACFQRQRNLIAVNPLTGDTQWSRAGIQPGSDVFGDGERLFITARNSNEALVLRALDGEELGHRRVPPPEQRLATLGSRVVTWTTVDGKMQLLMRDVWADKDLWQRSFDAGAHTWPIDDQAVGVLDRQGHFVVLALSDGSVQIDAKVPAEPTLHEVFVFRTPTHDLLVTNRPAQNRDGDNVQPVPGGFGNPVINGTVHGFERSSGKLAFSTPVNNRSLTFNQPSELPVLVFASQIYRTAAMRNSGEAAMPRAAVLCIDKRTGRVVYDEQSAGPITTIELQGDPDAHQVTLKTIRATARLTFTAEDWPAPDAAPKADAKSSLPSRAGRAVARGVQKWFEAITPPQVTIEIPAAQNNPPAEKDK